MKKEIPHVAFNPANQKHAGFEIVPLQQIVENQNKYDHHPELPHQLTFYNLIFFTEGNGRHFIDFNWYPVQKGSIVYLAKEQVNAFGLDDELKGYCIIFTEKYFVECFSALPNEFVFRLFNPELSSPVVTAPKESDFFEYFNLLNKEYNNESLFNRKNILNSLFVILISKLEGIKKYQTALPIDSSKTLLFQRFTSLLELNFAQHRDAQFYAEELAISYKHLNTICKNVINKTAKNVIDDFIILQAKRNLINSELKSSELAYKLGFEDPTNFTKYFKKKTGLTPNSFKKELDK
jgi:AraC-like DNA-binding protein